MQPVLAAAHFLATGAAAWWIRRRGPGCVAAARCEADAGVHAHHVGQLDGLFNSIAPRFE